MEDSTLSDYLTMIALAFLLLLLGSQIAFASSPSPTLVGESFYYESFYSNKQSCVGLFSERLAKVQHVIVYKEYDCNHEHLKGVHIDLVPPGMFVFSYIYPPDYILPHVLRLRTVDSKGVFSYTQDDSNVFEKNNENAVICRIPSEDSQKIYFMRTLWLNGYKPSLPKEYAIGIGPIDTERAKTLPYTLFYRENHFPTRIDLISKLR